MTYIRRQSIRGREIRKYHDEANRHQIVSAANMDAEINFLEKQIEQMQQELQSGSGKAYSTDMIDEMSLELTEKLRELADHPISQSSI